MECGALYAATVLSITDSEGTRELRWSTLYRLFSTQSLSAPSWILTRVLRFPTPEGWEHRKWKSNCNRARLRRFSLQDAVFFFLLCRWLNFFFSCCALKMRSEWKEERCSGRGAKGVGCHEEVISRRMIARILAYINDQQ
ncbi:T. brucei spp.-specific protein [Trypanosoma brucei gambiense DAL972]|uniref:T. brucei spp.-specific protein n=1 Tax=Trypanosoma brucei gambiense (strain MHOM/CI/86/DAL972) TaxID=679716 RepID=C9ZV69_TRYB9|nr:T. brucei spp.-specific protein [Trypanosoma brucei gambiense DAL972]CBH13307.1 T. brucei spp.-specific protein [Trypanosoma brucei gambiense DAL972]|eukprot:XP_011775584.1 T. brucei spp.-specific protein [Trypanosoma brucei gambiense DAL972]